MGRKILLVTTDQQRYDTLGVQRRHAGPDPGGRRTGRRGRPLRAGPSPVGGVHAVPVDHPHRTAPEHPRGVDERRAPPGRRPLGGRGAPRGRLSDRPGRQGPLRAVPRPVPPLRRERAWPRRAPAPRRAPPGVRAPGDGHPRGHGAAPLRPVVDGRAPRGPGWVLPGPRRLAPGERRPAVATPAPPRSRSTRSTATSTTPTGWPIGPSPGSTPSGPTRTGSAG